MKLSYRVASLASAAFFSIALSSVPANAQSTSGGQANTTTNSARGDDTRDHNYGWLSLLGLIGLASLKGRHRDDVNVTGRPVTR